ncbi:MAG: hypothetical protein IJX48_06400 [Paludibacteraceae bacterium]|nr:hypothetical protein [Paludibacteraceae bacterium]
MKKIFTLFAALTMVLSVSAVNIPAGTKLYLTPNANWNKDNARFAAYFFGDGETWVSMTKVAGETNLYEVTSPAGKSPANVIFCRMNPGTSTNNWDNKWNQTSDLTYDGTLNHYTVKDGTWDKGGGTWSIWPLPAEKTYKDITITVVANATPKIYWWDAGDKLADSDWEARPDMVATATANTYAYTLKDVDETKGVNFIITVGDIQSADQHTTTDVTKNFKEFLPQVVVMGVNNWDGTDKMTVSDDYLSASITFSLDANKAYQLKLTVDGLWVGGDDVNITKDKNSALFAEDTGGDGKITTDLAGDYVFTYTYATKTLVVTYPTPTYDVTTTATVSTQGQNIVLSGSWEEKALTVMLWQGGATQGFGTYAAEDYAPIFLGAAELTPTSEGVYADNSDGTFTFTATATDSEGAIYNITLTGDNPVVEPEYKEWEGSVLFTEEEGTLSISYAASDWSWFLELYIENYTGHSTYEVANVYYGDETVEYYDMYGTVTVEYADWAGTDVLYADLTSGDGTLKVWATLYNEDPVAAEYDVVITNATVTENTSGYYIDMTGEWDGHTIKVEVCDELTADNIRANFFIDGGIINGGNQAEGTVEATVSGGIVTITGTFECMGTGDVYHVTISGTLPDNLTTAVDNLNATVAPVKMINNGQLVIIKNGVQYNAQGAVVK